MDSLLRQAVPIPGLAPCCIKRLLKKPVSAMVHPVLYPGNPVFSGFDLSG